MSNNSIGSFLAALRKASGMTQKQLAEKLNVSDKAVSRWERDECAPDLSLIPVLAETYGVTSDEILRGQRADPDATPTAQSEEKAQKRLRHLLNQAETTYHVRSMVSCLIGAAGLIVAMICNLAFNRAYLGFLLGALLFVAAAVCQTIFSIQSRAALQNEDFDPDAVEETRRVMLKLSEKVYSLILFLFALTLPLMQAGDAYRGLSAKSWLILGLAYGGLAVLLCLLARQIIHVRKGMRKPIDWHSALNRLRLRMAGILALALLVTGVLHWNTATYLASNTYLYSDATRFDDWDSFKTYMEQPTSDDGEALTYQGTGLDDNGLPITIYTDELGNEHWYYEHSNATVMGLDGSILCSYDILNEYVIHVSYSSTDDKLPVYVQTREQYYHQASSRFNLLMAAWIPLYLAEAAVVVAIYRKKKGKIA